MNRQQKTGLIALIGAGIAGGLAYWKYKTMSPEQKAELKSRVNNAGDKIKQLKKAMDSSSPPPKCYSDVADGASGNRKLAIGCVYCNHKKLSFVWRDKIATLSDERNINHTKLSKEDDHRLEWAEQESLREELRDKPSELKRYENMIKQATFYANRVEGYRRKGQKQAAVNCHTKCESLCEEAFLHRFPDPNVHSTGLNVGPV